MGLFGKKLERLLSAIYRASVFEVKKTLLEMRTKSRFDSHSYFRRAEFEGRNYLGKSTSFVNGRLGFGSYINKNGDFTDTTIGRYTSIGADVSTVIGSHPTTKIAAMHPAFTDPNPVFGFSYTNKVIFSPKKGKIVVGNDVWIGNHVRIMDGVTIGNGAVVGTGAVVTKDLPPYSISVGVPAKVIKYRFDENTVERLEKAKWWDKGEEWIKSHGADFADVKDLLEALK